MKPVPHELLHRPFSRRQARAAGVTDRMLEGKRFVCVLPTVFRHRDHVMTDDDWVAAAALALPDHARLTGVTRIQQLGLDFGPRRPARFVVEGDLLVTRGYDGPSPSFGSRWRSLFSPISQVVEPHSRRRRRAAGYSGGAGAAIGGRQRCSIHRLGVIGPCSR